MSSNPSNFDSTRPPNGDVPPALQNVPEDVLLSWIEGEVSPAEAALYAERFPQAVAFVASMRRDRAMVAGACAAPVTAPSDLSDRVLAALERETLLGLSDGAPVSDSLPISQVPRRKTARDLWWANATPKLALAAGLALVVSVGTILVMRSGESPKPIGPVAINDAGNDGSNGIGSTEIAAPTNVASDGSAQSSGESSGGSPDVSSGATMLADAGSAPTAEHAAMKTASSDSALTKGGAEVLASGMTAEHALQLASEGRLVLRVRDAAAVGRLATTKSTASWRVSDPLPEMTVAMLAPAAAPVQAPTRVPFAPGIASLAGGEFSPISSNPSMRSRKASNPREALPAVPSAGRVVDVRDDAASLSALCAHLSKQLGASVELEEAAVPVTLDEAAPTAESVLWWLQPTQTWGKRVRLPLIIDAR